MADNDKFQAMLQKRIEDIQKQYAEDPRQKTFNALVYGDFGTGKTALAATCRFPVLIHSFDPGGTKTNILRPYIADGRILIDSRFENDRWKDPRAYKEWEREYDMLKQIGMFQQIGTYFFDGLSRWGDCLMYEAVKGRRLGKSTSSNKDSFDYQIQDYNVQQVTGVDVLGDMMNLPCDVIVTGHIGLDKDEVTGSYISGILLAGKFSAKVPNVFDEKYISRVTSDSSGKPSFKLQTHTVGIYKAETRIGGGKFETYEEPNIKKLLIKAGRPATDKPSFKEILGSNLDMPKV